MPETIYYRRKLPHIHPQNSPLFITFNLVDSVPPAVVTELKTQREKELQAAKDHEDRYKIQKKYFGYYDEWLDRCQYGYDWLKEETVAQIIAEELQKEAARQYELYTYCIMSNHVHFLIRKRDGKDYSLHFEQPRQSGAGERMEGLEVQLCQSRTR